MSSGHDIVLHGNITSRLENIISHAKTRDYSQSVADMKELLDLLPNHPSYTICVLEQTLAAGVNKREILKLINLFKKAFPTDPNGHLLNTQFYWINRDIEQIRKSWRETCDKASQGFHLQPVITATIFDAETGKARTKLGSLGLGARIRDHLNSSSLKESSEKIDPITDIALPVSVVTEQCEPVNGSTAAFNGRIEGLREPARYYYKYGNHPNNLCNDTAHRAVPGPRNARVVDFGENLFCAINAYAAQLAFTAADDVPTAIPDEPHATMNFEWPFGKDRNHKNGIGIIELLLGWKTAAHDSPRHITGEQNKQYPSVEYPGESVDLRDALVSIVYRSTKLDMRTYRPVAWIHGRTGTAAFPEHDNDLAAWALTGDFNNYAFVDDTLWHSMKMPLSALSTQWSFCGSNTEEMGKEMDRYTYAPIQSVLRENSSGNICICFLGEDELDTPEGSIEIAKLELSYRSWSMLSPGWGSTFLPNGTHYKSDPALLTNGTIRIFDNFWFDDFDSSSERTLTWRLRDSAAVQSFKIHQNLIAPTKDVEVSLSVDGETFFSVWSGLLDDVPEDPAAWAADVSKSEGSGFCTIVVLETDQEALFIRLTLKSSYRDGCIGLDTFEVFGEGLLPMPNGTSVSLSDLATGLQPNTPVYAKLVAECASNTFEGDVVCVNMPALNAPQILQVQILSSDETICRLAVRTRAAGTFATLRVSVINTDGATVLEKVIEVGKWDAARDTIVTLTLPDKSNQQRQIVCHLENASGQDLHRMEIP